MRTQKKGFSLDEVEPVERVATVVLQEASGPALDRFRVSAGNVVRAAERLGDDRDDDRECQVVVSDRCCRCQRRAIESVGSSRPKRETTAPTHRTTT